MHLLKLYFYNAIAKPLICVHIAAVFDYVTGTELETGHMSVYYGLAHIIMKGQEP